MAEPRFTLLGKLLSVVLVVGLIGLGAFMVLRSRTSSPGATGGVTEQPEGSAPEVSDVQVEVPKLAPPAPYQIKDNIIPVEISEYAGYAGLIAANGGLEPNDNSVFAKQHGFKVKLTISEDENWSELNEGKIAASVTTVDVLAAYGRQLHAVVPAQIGFSRGADGLVVRSDIKRINALQGKVVATAQFTEVDFFIRYLAQEAGLGVRALGSLDDAPDPEKINLVYTEDGFSAGDLFAADVKSGKNKLAGCVTWEPKTSEVVQQSNGKAHVLTTNRNLLIVADVMVVHRGLAEQHPEVVAGLVHGLLEGNRMVRDHPADYLDVVGRAFKWSRDETSKELASVHLSNLPENLAFFSGDIAEAGSFGGIYQSAVYAYGSDLIKDPVDADRFADLKALQALEKAGTFKDQKIEIAPIRTAAKGSIEADPLLSKDIRFLFEANSATLDVTNPDNLKNLEAIKKLVQVSPGSTLLLRGHVDNALVAKFRQQGGEAYVRTQALRAMELSKNRASEIRRLLTEKYNIPTARIDVVGRGWEEPVSGDSEQNRRVEVQWFTIE
ncbi:MAG TPA: phosphate ABC transporter substrate-binding/OmpA family protein [Vicinamibacterales bacterium]|nr:phosphate ABC transporter substrate-binding/OmpA family protein [Vicinamibacterales bacterium]